MADSVLEFTDDNFEAEVLNAEQPVLVDFWAPWCGPCRALSPTIEAVATDFEGKARVGKLNTDDNQQTAIKYGINSIPAVILFKGGEEVQRLVGGGTPKEKFAEVISSQL